MVKVYIFSGYGNNQSFELVGNSVTIGRSEENDIQIADMSVSRHHIQIMEKDDRLFIKDLNSQNGTYVNGTQITPDEYVEIKENYPIVIGMTLVCLGNMALEHVANFVNSMGPSVRGKDIDPDATTFFRPFTEIKNNELISNVNNVFHVSADVSEIAGRLLDHILNHFLRIDRVVIILCTENSYGKMIETVVSRSRSDSVNQGDSFSRMIVDRVISSRTPLVIPNVVNEKELELTGTLQLLKIGSVMCAPILKDNKLIGVLYIDSYEKPYGFREDDLTLITELSSLTAKSIEPFLVCDE
ncbi:MAG: FHA domain-containing protein [Deltaproteobacteria bacterium]|nr:FHA domain-containing protein [Deltaproteobacteria bacterium]